MVVMTNDPQRGKNDLFITGMVDRLMIVTPKYIRLSGAPGQQVATDVLIVPETKYAFRIIDAKSLTGVNIDFSFKEIKTENGANAYSLTVRNKRAEKGRYVDTIILKTTSEYQPEIKLQVVGIIE